MTTQTVNLFDPVTGLFVCQYEAHESPLEPDVFHAPEHSTPLPVPALSANEAAIFTNNAWSVVPDFRGQTWYDAQGNAVEITELGTPPNTLTPTLPPAILLANAKAAQITLLTAAYNAAIQQPVNYLGTTFQADIDSQNTLTKVLAGVTGSTPAGFYWVDVNNSQVAMTFAQLQGLSAAIMAQSWAAFQNLQTKKGAVKTATAVADVQAVVW